MKNVRSTRRGFLKGMLAGVGAAAAAVVPKGKAKAAPLHSKIGDHHTASVYRRTKDVVSYYESAR